MSHRTHAVRRGQPLRSEEFGTVGEFVRSVGRGNGPVALMLTCWELGDIPDQISHVQPGDVLIVQNPAGVVPQWGQIDPGAATASICYGLNLPTVRHLIVCGHRDCRMVPLLVGGRTVDRLTEYRRILTDVRDQLDGLDDRLGDRQRGRIAVEEVVLQQLRHLRTFPEVRRGVWEGKLRLHGWYYDDRTARVYAYSPRSNQFYVV